ncbi:MAG: hypothetical protein R3B99_06560 [Polyangiales bacterium]
MLRLLGLVGDVHAEEQRLARALDSLFASRGVDRVAQVEDFVDGMGSDASVRRLPTPTRSSSAATTSVGCWRRCRASEARAAGSTSQLA